MLQHQLRKLDLSGFKTFARRTEVTLPSGVTGIVGPNGSGKSNLADALRWVLGEQSLQHIRSKKTEDVIFAGGANRPPMGMAEVTLTLDNTAGWIPLDFSEVTIGRRAYRSGENEYFINNTRVRLRDVIDLRNRAGFGQSSYSVIGQGLVDSVLSQRPEERRQLFEEAAGIRHYQAKRDQTLDQLAATRQNLVRVQDIVAEIEPRLETLRRQSEKARQHTELSEELRTLQIRWYAARHCQLQRQVLEAEELLSQAQRALGESEGKTQELERAAAALEAQRQVTEQSVARETQRAGDLRRRLEQLQGQIDLAQDKLRFMQQQGQETERELADLGQAQDALRQQRDELQAAVSTLQATEAALAREVATAEAEAAGRLAGVRALDQRLQQARERLSQAISARDGRKREAEQLDERRRDLQRQATQHTEDANRKTGLVNVLKEKQDDLQRQVQALRGDEEQLSGKIEAARLDSAAALSIASEKQAAMDELRRTRDELATRLRLLQELQSNLEGLADGTRALLASQRPGIDGALSEGLKVEPGYERAIAAALGHKLDAVLVASQQAANDILADPAVTEATLVLDELGNPHPNPLPERDGIRTAMSVILAAHHSLTRLLADVLIADSLVAMPGWRVVTVGGDVLDLDGTITRRAVSAGEAVLRRQQSLDDLATAIETAEAQLSDAAAEHLQLQAEAETRAATLTGLQEQGRQQATGRQQRLGQLRDLAQQLQAAQAQVDWLGALAEQVEEQLRQLDQRRAGLTGELDQLSEQIPDLQGQVQAIERESAASVEAGQAGSQRLGELRLELGVTRQRQEHARAQHAQLEQQLAGAERQLAARRKRSEEHGAVLAQLQAEIEAAASELARVGKQLQDQEQLLPPLRNRLATAVEELRTLRQRETTAHDEHAELDKRCYRLSFDSQHKRDELDALAGSLLEDLQLTLDVLPEPQPDVPEPAKREVDALKTRLAALGPINPDALAEFMEVQERHHFLTTQKADLDAAAAQLQVVIAELEELTRRQFLETFELVAKELERFFQLMFNGGQVQMFLTDPDSVNTTGIEILAQPPGKRLQALPLLSGGERALVASALLFAILATKPVPFCLLDEVDAALDEANVKRFCQALKSLAEQTQFVVITHNRETMAIADALYGVSMSQDGVSKLVSLRLPREDRWQEAEEDASREAELAAS